jgi:hypothetical protein
MGEARASLLALIAAIEAVKEGRPIGSEADEVLTRGEESFEMVLKLIVGFQRLAGRNYLRKGAVKDVSKNPWQIVWHPLACQRLQ